MAASAPGASAEAPATPTSPMMRELEGALDGEGLIDEPVRYCF